MEFWHNAIKHEMIQEDLERMISRCDPNCSMNELKRELETATKQILVSAFEEFAKEDKCKVLRVLNFSTEINRSTERTLLIALDVVHSILKAHGACCLY